MSWAALVISILTLVAGGIGLRLNRRAINAEAADRRAQLDLLRDQMQRDSEREARDVLGAATVVCAELARARRAWLSSTRVAGSRSKT
jgi:hypothetical protein